MYPVLIRIFGVPIYSYGFMLAVSFLICVILALRQAANAGIEPHHILDLSLYIIISGIVGARLLYVVQNWSYYSKHLFEIVLINRGGLSLHGGILLAFLVGCIIVKRRRLPAGKIIDLVMLYLPLGIAIGRIGCFLNGCCYGKPTNYFCGVLFPKYSLAYQHFKTYQVLYPVQLYSALANIAIFVILGTIYKYRKRYDGELLFYFMFYYGTARFLIEFLRADNPLVWYGFDLPQLISLGMVIIAVSFLLPWGIKYGKRK